MPSRDIKRHECPRTALSAMTIVPKTAAKTVQCHMTRNGAYIRHIPDMPGTIFEHRLIHTHTIQSIEKSKSLSNSSLDDQKQPVSLTQKKL
jgi:hypothetical protein